MYPPNHYSTIKTDWPPDNPESLHRLGTDPLVMIWRNKSGNIKVTGEAHFHTTESRRVTYLIETAEKYKNLVNLNFEEYYHVVQLIQKEDVSEIRLVAMRDRINLQLQNEEVLKETANAAKFK